MKITPTLQKVYHITAFSWYAYIVKSLADRGGQELPPGIFVYGGPWKYLTFLNLLLQMFFFGLAAVNDLQPHQESTLNQCKDFLFSVFVFPVGMFVVLLFWTIFAYDRELVYPATIDTFFPPWINHAMHTFVFPVLFGEILMQPHMYPRKKHALAALTVVGVSYIFWIIWVFLSTGIWVYPLLGLFSMSGLVGFFIFNMSVVTLLYMLGEKLNHHTWSKKLGRTCAERWQKQSDSSLLQPEKVVKKEREERET